MDSIGDIRYRTYPSGKAYKEIYNACDECGKGRWQMYSAKCISATMCRSCSLKIRHSTNKEWVEKLQSGIRRRWDKPGAKELASNRMSGENNPFYGKKHSDEELEIMSRPRGNYIGGKLYDIRVGHTNDWGYLIGLVLGDGCIVKTKGGNYKVVVDSTKPEIVDKFYECAKSLNMNCHYGIAEYIIKKSSLESINKRIGEKEIRYRAEICSKRLYMWLRPYKYEDYHFTVPTIIYNDNRNDMLTGFVSGFYDAEGGIYRGSSENSFSIECYSKHKSNLEQIQKCLSIIGINSYISVRNDRHACRLIIAAYKDRIRFMEMIRFRIDRKQNLLNNMGITKKQHYDKDAYNTSMELIKSGMSYHEIEQITNVHHSTLAVWKHLHNKSKIIASSLL